MRTKHEKSRSGSSLSRRKFLKNSMITGSSVAVLAGSQGLVKSPG
jgi:hypothetical protein